MKITIKTLALTSVGLAVIGAGVLYSGVISVAADEPHSRAVEALLAITRERSIAVRAREIEVPSLDDEALIRSGAGNYHAMCIGCHLAPEMPATELSESLYPAPPNLAKRGTGGDPGATFWVIKHGIKATGMPAWGKSMGDDYIWGMVAFIDRLPQLDAAQYQSLVAASDGHQHGGGESDMHDHSGQHASPAAPRGSTSAADDHHGAHDDHAAKKPKAEADVHHHPDGSRHVH
ncbi:cytochrome c [Pseudomonas stutzeri]|uniref:Cytochrome C n=1 Tax=Stutzerimonas stutzeri TaxID=316 RepID=A0A2N8S6W2_STUST|nr:cytochrome c [Stutzerimonas stutzeri]MCQ4294662.1 cytochrome c [Stutzerimonas stutzeri]PNF82359.1 cytochrome C [Stutzerimonas stutzeri]